MKFFRWLWLVCLFLGAFTFATNVAHAATFSGKVVSPEGNPVAGATLWAGAVGLTSYSEDQGTMKHVTTGDDGAVRVWAVEE